MNELPIPHPPFAPAGLPAPTGLPYPATDPGLRDALEVLAMQLDVPVAVVWLTGGENHWIGARDCLDALSGLATEPFCRQVAEGGRFLVVEDAAADARFADDPMVQGEFHVRFGAGVPLLASSGRVLGSLCVLDRQPRVLSELQQRAMSAMARLAARTLESIACAARNEMALREASDAAVLYVDEAGTIVWAGARARQWLSLPADLDGRPVPLASCLLDPQRIGDEVLPGLREGRALRGLEVELPSMTATPRRVRLDIEPLGGEAPLRHARCTVTELGAPADRSTMLRQYELLFEFSLDLFCTVDGRFHFDLLNPAWEKVLGWTRQELREHPFNWFLHPDDVAPSEQAARRLLESGGTLERFENRYRTRDGAYRVLAWQCAVVAGTFVATARDVTAEVDARERLAFRNAVQQLIAELQHAVIETGHADPAWWKRALDGLIGLTGSEYGFIGTVEEDGQGRFLRTHSITDISWDEHTRELYRKSQSEGMAFRNLNTLFGRAMLDGATVVANDVAHDPRATGRPHGHPALNSFLGLACGEGESMVGLIGLANRPNGYSPEVVADLQGVAVLMESLLNQARDSARIRAAESRLNAVVNSTPDAIITIDARGIILSANPAVRKLFGYEPQECIGNNVAMLMNSAEGRAHDRFISAHLATGENRIIGRGREVLGRRKDGSPVWLDLAISEVSLDGATCFTGILRDITARVANEQKLRDTAAHLSSALQMAKAGHWEYDVAADRFTFNDAFYAIFGTTAEREGGYLLSSREYATRFVHPDEVSIVAESIRAALGSRDPAFQAEVEHRFLYADGRTGQLAVRLFATADETGRIVKLFGVNQDITERLQQEQARVRMAEQERLNQALAQRVEELDRSQTVSALTTECVQLLHQCVSLQEGLDLTCRFVARMYPHANVAVYVCPDPNDELMLHSFEHRFGEASPAGVLEHADCWAVRTRRVYSVTPGGTHTPCPHCGTEAASVLVCAPLLCMDQLVGLISIALPPVAQHGTYEQERVARSVAQFETTVQSLGSALSAMSLRASLQRLALVDELTGLPNRRALLASAQRHLARARRARQVVVVAMFDVDHFKAVNDSLGHEEGDRVLKQLAKVAEQYFRAGDLVGRVGGEEFAVILTGIGAQEAHLRLEAFRAKVRAQCVAGTQPVTVSVGYTVADASSTLEFEQLLHVADGALYDAKNAGRDRVHQAPLPR